MRGWSLTNYSWGCFFQFRLGRFPGCLDILLCFDEVLVFLRGILLKTFLTRKQVFGNNETFVFDTCCCFGLDFHGKEPAMGGQKVEQTPPRNSPLV